MRIFYLSTQPILSDSDRDPRRRNLYGPDVVQLSLQHGEATSSHASHHQAQSYPCNSSPLELASRVLRQYPDGVLVIGEHALASPFCGKSLPFVFDPTDSHSLYFQRRIGPLGLRAPIKSLNSLRLTLKFRSLETKILRSAACFVTTGVADEAHLKSLCPDATVLRVGNGTDIINEPPVCPEHDGRTIGFHGGMTWEPNRHAAKFLANPLADALVHLPGPQFRILLAGRPMPSDVQQRHGMNGVEICGFVEDLRAWFASISLYVMPMTLGSGVKNKLAEAMAAGVPVLTNERGAESLPSEGRATIAIAEGHRGIACAIRRLLDSPAELDRMRREGRAFAEQHFDWSLHRRKFFGALHDLRRRGRL